MSTDGGQTFPTVFTVPFESAIPALAVAQNGTVGLLDTALFNNDLLTQFWELSANLQPLQLTAGSGNLTLSDFTDGLRYVRDPYIGDYEGLVRKSAQRHTCRTIPSQPPRLRLCPQGRNRTRRRRTRRSPKAGRRRSLFQHRSSQGLSGRMAGGAGDSSAVRTHLFRPAAQGGDAGGMILGADNFLKRGHAPAKQFQFAVLHDPRRSATATGARRFAVD
jgi:hypothetical protein